MPPNFLRLSTVKALPCPRRRFNHRLGLNSTHRPRSDNESFNVNCCQTDPPESSLAPASCRDFTGDDSNPSPIRKMSTPLFDPNDPLVSNLNLITNALEVLAEVRYNLSTEEGLLAMVIDTDPEFLDASFEYLSEVLEALKERQA